jgi:preprotein translocase subunit SecA
MVGNQQDDTDRAVLILCEDIATAKRLNVLLRDKAIVRVELYSRSDLRSNQANVKKQLHPGDVLIATNLGSRGTDYQIDPDVIQSGGLFVIITYLPNNDRVEQQAFGRTARQGLRGTAQIIVNRERLTGKLRQCRNFHPARALQRDKAAYP